ncbi:MMPL family transporter [Cryptosporangium sp. NPDC048952]|uniref:MMPL family transporter n=1 Tax=Cryptosporangium sp. NPDC048952 TaxID=3363961 RepID=UPI003713CC8F
MYGNAPIVLAAIVIATFLPLARALRSFWLPVKALLLNVVSIGAAYGLTVLIWQEGLGTRSGVRRGRQRRDRDLGAGRSIGSTGRLVTSAALILFLSFVALSTVPTIDVKILATALALGIAIDAVIVRALLAPALVAVLGQANWTMPGPLATLLVMRANGRPATAVPASEPEATNRS